MSIDYYDRAGQPITRDEYLALVEGNSRRVAYDEIGDVEVSTVWLGLDHQYGDGPPLIFETMIFGGDRDGDQWRYPTEELALLNHAAQVALLKALA